MRQAGPAARQALGLSPYRRENHREKALGAANPSSADTSLTV